jgi:hypothetical protein
MCAGWQRAINGIVNREDHIMPSNQRLIVDATDVVLRLHCKCGAEVSVAPAAMKLSVFFCSNCDNGWPDAVGENGMPRMPAERLAVALRDLQKEETATGYRVQFEVPIEEPTA